MRRTYTHEEEMIEKVHKAQADGLHAAEQRTKLKLRKAS
jgi:hypothetical protein